MQSGTTLTLMYCDVPGPEWHKIFTSNPGVSSEMCLEHLTTHIPLPPAPLGSIPSLPAWNLGSLLRGSCCECGVPTFRTLLDPFSGLEAEVLNLDWRGSCREPERAEWCRCFFGSSSFPVAAFWSCRWREESSGMLGDEKLPHSASCLPNTQGLKAASTVCFT